MKEELNNINRSIDSEWTRINKNAGDHNNFRNFFVHERIRVTFSDKMDENTESTNENVQTDYYKKQVSEQTANRTESGKSNLEKPVSENPGKEIDKSEPVQKPEKGDGVEIKNDKPEIVT